MTNRTSGSFFDELEAVAKGLLVASDVADTSRLKQLFDDLRTLVPDVEVNADDTPTSDRLTCNQQEPR